MLNEISKFAILLQCNMMEIPHVFCVFHQKASISFILVSPILMDKLHYSLVFPLFTFNKKKKNIFSAIFYYHSMISTHKFFNCLCVWMERREREFNTEQRNRINFVNIINWIEQRENVNSDTTQRIACSITFIIILPVNSHSFVVFVEIHSYFIFLFDFAQTKEQCFIIDTENCL